MLSNYLNELVTLPRSRLVGLYGSNIISLGFLLVISDRGVALEILGFVIAFVGLAMLTVAGSMIPRRNNLKTDTRQGTEK